jgi:hypothetical protein
MAGFEVTTEEKQRAIRNAEVVDIDPRGTFAGERWDRNTRK